MYWEHENYMKTDNEEKPLWSFAREAFYAQPPAQAEDWARVSEAVIAEHERRELEKSKNDLKQLIHEFVNESDPNAECKAAFAAGKRIQFKGRYNTYGWSCCYNAPVWFDDCEYRVHPDDVEKPGTLGRSVNGYTLADGQEWHRTDWTQDMLPDGYRPRLVDERISKDSRLDFECCSVDPGSGWGEYIFNGDIPDHLLFFRTTRPLPTSSDPFADAKRWFVEGRLQHSLRGVWEDWNAPDSPPTWKQWSVEKFRERPEPKWVPLGPDDVPPATVLRGAGETSDAGWCMIVSCSLTGIRLWHANDASPREIKWQHLFDSGAEINRSIPNLGKWVADAWVPCRRRRYEA